MCSDASDEIRKRIPAQQCMVGLTQSKTVAHLLSDVSLLVSILKCKNTACASEKVSRCIGEVTTTGSLHAKIFVPSPLKLHVFIIYKNVFWIEVSKRDLLSFWKQKHWLDCRQRAMLWIFVCWTTRGKRSDGRQLLSYLVSASLCLHASRLASSFAPLTHRSDARFRCLTSSSMRLDRHLSQRLCYRCAWLTLSLDLASWQVRRSVFVCRIEFSTFRILWS